VTRKPTPAPTLPQPDDLPDKEIGSPSIIEHTGADRCSGVLNLPELSSAKHANDVTEVGLSPGVSGVQSTADVDIGALAIYPPFLP
jgi:hypothetical protein